MKLTKDDFLFITKIIELNKKRILLEDFSNLKPSQVQYKFEKINYLLKITNRNIIKKRFGNFYVNNLNDLETIIENFEFASFNKAQRMNIILQKLLVENKLNINELENIFSQSRSAVKKDLKFLKDELELNSIELIYKNRVGLVLDGAENNIRFFLLNYFFKNYDFFYENIYMNKTNFFVFNMLKGKNSSFETSKILNVILAIQYHRIKNNNLLTSLKDPFFSFSFNNEYKLNLYNKFISRLVLTSNDYYEKSSILFFLNGLCYSDNNLIILKKEELFFKSVLTLLENIGAEYNLPLHKDDYLLKTLSSHLKSALFKLYNNIPIINPCTTVGIIEYKDLISKIKKEIRPFEKNFKVTINMDEIIFILFHIKSSMIRLQKEKINEKNVLLVCNLGAGASQVLKDQLLKHFLINVVDEVSFYQFQVYDLSKIDFIIHTIEAFNHSLPSVKVNPLLTMKDINLLEKSGFMKV